MIDWKKDLTVRPLNCLENEFGKDFDLNNPMHRLEYTLSATERIPNWGVKAQREVDLVVKRYWPDFPTKYNFEREKLDIPKLRSHIKRIRSYLEFLAADHSEFENNEFVDLIENYHDYNYLEHYRS